MKRALLLVFAAVLMVFALSGVALAATSQDIYDDYVDNGKLDGTYTDSELRAFLRDAGTLQYGNPDEIKKIVDDITQTLNRNEFPFTGAQLAIMAIAAVVLIGGGIGLRRLARRRA